MKIHAGVVKAVSDPLHAMINNGMQESLTGVAILEDVEASTFAAFCEYVYPGAYTTPKRKDPPASKEAGTEGHNTADQVGSNAPGEFLRLIDLLINK